VDQAVRGNQAKERKYGNNISNLYPITDQVLSAGLYTDGESVDDEGELADKAEKLVKDNISSQFTLLMCWYWIKPVTIFTIKLSLVFTSTFRHRGHE